MTVESSDFKTVVVRNSFLFPQRAFWYIGRNFPFSVLTVTLLHFPFTILTVTLLHFLCPNCDTTALSILCPNCDTTALSLS